MIWWNLLTGAWDEGDGNDVVWFCLMVLVASEVCSFENSDNGGSNEIHGNEDEYIDLEFLCSPTSIY